MNVEKTSCGLWSTCTKNKPPISTQPLKEFDDSHPTKKAPAPVWSQLFVSYTWRFVFKVLQLMAWIPRFFFELEMKPHGIRAGGRETLI